MTITSIAVVTPPGVTVVAAPYAPAGPIVAGTSSTTNDISIGGTYVWTMDQVGLGFMAGTRVRATAADAPTNWIEGVVTVFDGTDLTVVSDKANGVGVFESWNISIAGEPGTTGQKGDTGAVGPQGPQGIVSLDSPFFTGDPRAPTPLPGDNDNSIATTQFVTSALSNKQNFDPDLTSLAAASGIGVIYYRSAADTWGPVTVGAGLSFVSGTLSLSAASFDSPTFTGDPQSVTFPKTDNDTTIATTAFVHDVVSDYAPLDSAALIGTPTAPTVTPATDASDAIATTQFVQDVAAGLQPLDGDLTSLAEASGTDVWYYRSAADTWMPVTIGANLLFAGGTLSATGGGGGDGGGAPTDSPVFTGDPQVPTAPAHDSDATIANTQWVQLELAAYAKLAGAAFTATPSAPTATPGDSTTKLATTQFVGTAITAINLSAYAPLASPALTGTPTAPTQVGTDNSTKIATTAFVKGQSSASLDSPVFTGDPRAPTPATSDNDTSIATTAYVKAQLYAPLASPAFTGAPTAPTAAPADNSSALATTAFVKAQGGSSIVINIRKFTTSGTYTPTAGTAFAIVEGVGSGAGGGGATGSGSGNGNTGGGGGSGGHSRRLLTAADIGASKPITIGPPGTGGINGDTDGGDGGDVSLGSLLIAKGGKGGAGYKGGVASGVFGGAGGPATGAVGDITSAGAPGASASFGTSATSSRAGGEGGSSIFGGGGVAPSAAAGGTAVNGGNASNYGSGGSGGAANGAISIIAVGGNGSAGIIVVTEFTGIGFIGSPGGNVSNVGAPALGQIARWTNVTTIEGISPADAAPSGTLILLQSQTVSTPVASIDFTGIDGTYDEYEFHFIAMQPSVDSNFGMRISLDGGATYRAGTSEYNYGGTASLNNTTHTAYGSTSTLLLMSGQAFNSGSASNFSGHLRLVNPANSGLYKFITYHIAGHGSSNIMSNIGGGTFFVAGIYGPWNAVRFIYNAANIAAGTIKMYGIKK